MEFIAQDYLTLPDDKTLKKQLDKFIEVHGNKKMKAGCVGRKKVDTRYSGNGVFKKLDAHNLFCKTQDFELATTIEGKLKEFLMDLDICENLKNDYMSGNEGNDKHEWLVYLVEMNEDLRLCSMKGCGTVMTTEHIDSYQYMQNLKYWKQIQVKKGSNAIDTLNTDPMPYYHDAYKAEVCKFCGMVWPDKFSMNQKQYHLSTCLKNPQPLFKCPICGERWDRKRQLDKHLKKHDKKNEQQKRQQAFTCRYCNGSFNDH